MRIVVALGGNAISHPDDRGTAPEQRTAIRGACEGLAALVAAGHELVLTHGNGPQVGRQMLLSQALARQIPPMPLDALVAETQGFLGYLLQGELAAALARAGVPRGVVTLVSQVRVDPSDPGFRIPVKPVGPTLVAAEVAELRRSGVAIGEAPRGGWRRLVPSPRPVELIERDALAAVLAAGQVPIACGGGGIPVVREGSALRGVEAVVDKDLAAVLLVEAAAADALLILTDVDRVVRAYGTDDAEPLAALHVKEARAVLAAGAFPPGSMAPKVEAAVMAAERGARAIIASLGDAVAAIAGEAGTEILA